MKKTHYLLIFTGEFKTKYSKNGGVFQLDQAKVLKKYGFKTGILAPCILSPRRIFKKYEYKSFEYIEGVPVFRDMKKNFLPGKIHFLNYFLKNQYIKLGLKMFENYVTNYGIPDYVQVFDIRFGLFVATAIKKKYKIPIIFTEYCVESLNNTLPLSENFIKNYVKPSLSKVEVISTASKDFSKKFKKIFSIKKKVFFISPVIPIIKKEKLKIFNKDPKIYKFITVNRLDDNKNVELIIKAYCLTFQKNKKVKLIIAGDGPNFNKINNIIKKYDAFNSIKIIRNLSRDKMLNLLNKSNCCLSSSYHETFGVILVEALSRGIPVISTKSEGPLEIINDLNGLLVPINNKYLYAAAMKKIFNNKSKYIKNNKKIISDIYKRYGHEKYINKLNNIIRDCYVK